MALDRLGTVRLLGLEARRRRALVRAVEAAEASAALFHRHRATAPPVPHPIALVPFLVPRGLVPALARVASLVHRVQAHAPRLWADDVGAFRTLCPVSEVTARWLARPAARRVAPWALMIRPDVGLERRPGGRLRPVLFETNATALAGLYNHTAGVDILQAHVFPRLYTAAEARRLGAAPDLLALTVRWVRRAARRLGRARLRGVGFVEPAGPVAGYSEVPRLVAAFAAAGIRAVHGTPEDLRLHGDGDVRLRGVSIDMVYRDLALEDLGDPEDPGLRPVRTCLDAGAVLPGLAGEFSQKGLLEWVGGPEAQRLYGPAERRLLRSIVPWTRVLSARRTADPAGRPVDLPEFARRARTRLLIKPNVGSSGAGILLGPVTPPARWEARLVRALREPGAWVVQAWRPGIRRPTVYLRRGRLHAGLCHFSLGLFYAPVELGLHCRVSDEPIVNVARRGALACAFLVAG